MFDVWCEYQPLHWDWRRAALWRAAAAARRARAKRVTRASASARRRLADPHRPRPRRTATLAPTPARGTEGPALRHLVGERRYYTLLFMSLVKNIKGKKRKILRSPKKLKPTFLLWYIILDFISNTAENGYLTEKNYLLNIYCNISTTWL